MEPVKFEDNIKGVLAKREIKPSKDSWQKLEKRLEQQEEKSRTLLWWMGIAAAFAGVFFLGTTFDTPDFEGTPMVLEQDVDEPVQKDSTDLNSGIVPEKVEKPERKRAGAVTNKKVRVLKKSIIKPDVIEKMKAKTRVADIEPGLQTPKKQAPQNSQSVLAVAEVSPLQKNTAVTDAEIEALLIEAQKWIEEDSSARDAYTVNPAELLDNVEDELDETFRQKVLEVLKEGFSKAKTAVANRNL